MRYGDHSFFQTGVAVPLFSLRSNNSVGIGEFLDLIPFANWAKRCGLNVIQILPVNDTGFESSPYSARSAFALNPVFINMQVVRGSDNYKVEIETAQKRFADEPRVHFEEVSRWKRAVLRKIFDARYEQLEKNIALSKWIEANPWVKPYAVYAFLKDENHEASWRSWKNEQNPTSARIDSLWRKNRKDSLFQSWMQFEAEAQFKVATSELSKIGMHLKGDIPILINEDSADVWYDRKFFSLDDRAGAPPDMFSYSGQNWGFPTYRWDVIEKDNFAWWRARLAQASKFYHAYRIDHVLGFFRIWAIPQCQETGILGHFSPAVPISLETLVQAGFKRETIDYLQRPNFSKEQLSSFLGSFVDTCIKNYFDLLPNSKDRYVLKEEFSSERAILSTQEEQKVKDGLLKVYWDRVFVPGTPEGKYYPYWYWYDQAVLYTLPMNEQNTLHQIMSANAKAQEDLWRENGMKLLSKLVNETDMLVCAEDLGAVPHCVPDVLFKLNILSLRVERWARNWDSPYSPYYEAEDYPRLSVSTTSVHDSSTLLGLWVESGFDRATYWRHLHLPGEVPDRLTPDVVEQIIRHIFSTNSLFCIPPLQDLLAMSARWVPENPEEERINIPGTIGPKNWSYKMPCTIEELSQCMSLSSTILRLVEERKNRPIWKI